MDGSPKKTNEEEEEPVNAYWDERGDDDWDERDLAKLTGGYKPELDEPRNQDKTSDQPKESEK
jgi:hypothetical protein